MTTCINVHALNASHLCFNCCFKTNIHSACISQKLLYLQWQVAQLIGHCTVCQIMHGSSLAIISLEEKHKTMLRHNFNIPICIYVIYLSKKYVRMWFTFMYTLFITLNMDHTKKYIIIFILLHLHQADWFHKCALIITQS